MTSTTGVAQARTGYC